MRSTTASARRSRDDQITIRSARGRRAVSLQFPRAKAGFFSAGASARGASALTIAQSGASALRAAGAGVIGGGGGGGAGSNGGATRRGAPPRPTGRPTAAAAAVGASLDRSATAL